VDFESANPTVVKSIKQRDLLNTWLRLFAREQKLPALAEYQPARIEDELPDLVYFSIDTRQKPPRIIIDSDGTRMASAYGHTGKGRRLEDYLGSRLAPLVMPVYYECIRRRLPAYTIANIDDSYGRIVAYERLLLPFSEGGNVTHIIASLKTISEDGGFEIRNLMRGGDKLPMLKLRAIIDRELFHRAPGRSFRTRAGTPPAIVKAGTSFVTTAPAPTIAPAPMRTPPSKTAPEPSEAPRSTTVSSNVQSSPV
jgi:hypothetical protein